MVQKNERRGTDGAVRAAKGNAIKQDPSNLDFHPLANIFPLMEGEEFDELAADIKSHGLREPIWRFENKILDGRNRYRACIKAGVEPKFRHFSGTHGAACDFVVSANIRRRHLTGEQKREIISKLLATLVEKSDRQIAKQVKVSHHTVATVRAEMEERGQIAHVENRTDTKGRQQPARKPPTSPPASQAREWGLKQTLTIARCRAGDRAFGQAVVEPEIKPEVEPEILPPLKPRPRRDRITFMTIVTDIDGIILSASDGTTFNTGDLKTFGDKLVDRGTELLEIVAKRKEGRR